MSAFTPAELVVLDHMRSVWDEETILRMLRAMDGRLECAVVAVSEAHQGSARAASKGSAAYSEAFLWTLYGDKVVDAMELIEVRF